MNNPLLATSASPRIAKLPMLLADQIAAGEIIERPASVVKELLENSIDAGASKIDIIIEKSGRELISVTDNGHGIHPEDLRLACDRFATSKIRHPDDLLQIRSLGFRGEALASIAAISDLHISSRYGSTASGWRLDFLPDGQGSSLQPVAHPVGTSVSVANLFFKTPARRKFLKSDRTEWLHIQTLIKCVALSCPHINISCRHNGILTLQYPTSDNPFDSRVQAICGSVFLQQSKALSTSRGHIQLSGLLGLPTCSRSQSDRQYFFLNGRMLRSQLIQHAIRSAYADLIHPGRFPCYVLYMEISPEHVDVNVHPTKYDVRFRESRDVHNMLHTLLRGILLAGKQDSNQSAESVFHSLSQPSTAEQTAQDRGQYLIVGAGRFLLSKTAHGAILVDLFAARERIVMIRLQDMYAEHGIQPAPILVPIIITLAQTVLQYAADHEAELRQLGFSIIRSGIDSMRIQEVPSLLQTADITALVTHLLNALPRTEPEDLLLLMAQHVNDSAPQALSTEEIQQMLAQIEHYRQTHGDSFWQGIYSDLQAGDLAKWLT